MKVLLINPAPLIRKSIIQIHNTMPSYSLLYLSPFLKQDGHFVKYAEGYFSTDYKLLKEIESTKPHVIGMSVYTSYWERTKKLAEKIKMLFPDIKIVIGGIHPTIEMEKCLKECKFIDMLVYGEGEETFAQLINYLEKGKNLDEVKGIIFREKGKLVRTPAREIKNLDSLPFPDRRLVDWKKYRPSLIHHKKLPSTAIFGSRGCPFRCIFCHASGKIRMRSPKNIVDEIEECVKKYGISDFIFYDNIFTINQKRAEEICDEIIKRKLRITWRASARADLVNEKLLEKMKRAGCWLILYGIESGVQKNLDTLQKDLKIEQIEETIKLTKEVGISTLGTFMFGIPGETFEEGIETIKFACKLDLDWANFFYLTPYPGTKLYKMILRGKCGKVKKDAEFDLKTISFVPNSMTEEELKKLMDIAFKKFYCRSKMIKKIKDIRSIDNFKDYVNGLLFLIFKKIFRI